MPVEGRDLSSRQTQYVVKDVEIGKPIKVEILCRRGGRGDAVSV
jgi:hypothetical protein